MKTFHATSFLALSSFLEASSRLSGTHFLYFRKITAAQRAVAEKISKIEPTCRELGLVASSATIHSFKIFLEWDKSGEHPFMRHDYLELAREFQGRLQDELKNRECFVLTSTESEQYKAPTKGWEIVIARFPESGDDIEEAYKCFALSRYIASVFHSLQVVEIGVIYLGGFLGVTDPLPGWSATTNKLSSVLKTKYQDRTPSEQKHSTFLEQIKGTVSSLQTAWRNKISHVENKLILVNKNFSPEIAEEILVATRAFMRRLAEELPS